jgi:hypothetical protein
MHGGFSLVSYAVEFSGKLGYSEEEKDKIVKDLITASSFDMMLEIFTRNFGSIVNIQYRHKIILTKKQK